MGWNPFKKDVTVTSGGSEAFIPVADVNAGLKASKKKAIQQYIFDTSGLAPFSHEIKITDYLIGLKNEGMLGAWEKAYHWALSGNYHHIGLPYEYDVPYRGQYYPTIPLKIHHDGNTVDVMNNPYTAYSQQVKASITEIGKVLGMPTQKLRDDIFNAMGEGNWNSMLSVVVHLSSGLHGETLVEPYGQYGTVAYNYRFLGYYHKFRERVTAYPLNIKGVYIPMTPRLHSIRDGVTTQKGVWSGQFSSPATPIRYSESTDPDTAGYNYIYDPERAPWRDANNISRGRMSRDEYFAYVNSKLPGHIRNMPHKAVGVKYEDYVENTFNGSMRRTYVTYYYRARNTGTPEDFIFRTVTVNHEDGSMQGKWDIGEAGAWIVPNQYTRTDVNENTEGTLFPINRELLSLFTNEEKERIIQESFRVSWLYQTKQSVYRGWVTELVKIGKIAIQLIVTNMTFGAGSVLNNNLAKIAASLVGTYAVNKLIDFGVKLGIISPQVAGILRIVVTIVTMAHGVGWDFSKVLTAPNIMKVVNQSFDYYNKRQQEQIAKANQQLEEHNKYHADRMAKLAEKQKMADLGVVSDPSLYLDMPSFAPSVNLFETPEMMYARHYNFNVVNVSHGLISNLADGLKYRQVDRIQQVRDITQEIEDVLLIT